MKKYFMVQESIKHFPLPLRKSLKVIAKGDFLVFLIVLFLITLMSSYCLAASPIEDEHRRGHHQHKEEGRNIELSGKVENGIRIIEVKASRYKFDPDPIVAGLGEKVRLVVTSTDVAHGIAIIGFKVKLSVAAGKTERVEFIADKKGEFHVYCSVYCGPGHGHMHATFMVK